MKPSRTTASNPCTLVIPKCLLIIFGARFVIVFILFDNFSIIRFSQIMTIFIFRNITEAIIALIRCFCFRISSVSPKFPLGRNFFSCFQLFLAFFVSFLLFPLPISFFSVTLSKYLLHSNPEIAGGNLGHTVDFFLESITESAIFRWDLNGEMIQWQWLLFSPDVLAPTLTSSTRVSDTLSGVDVIIRLAAGSMTSDLSYISRIPSLLNT